jgi:tetratricopeptide (TPR) repeat protein
MGRVAAAVLSFVLVGIAPAASGQALELEQAQALLEEGKAEEAWRLLAPLERRYAGQPEFDLALAVVATSSGRPNLATFALERVLITQPGNAMARLELARAFFALRDYERAERELRFILEGDPPPAIRAMVTHYRESMHDAASAAAAAPSTGWSAYAQVGVGSDSNANVATAQGSIFVPSLGTQLIVDRAFVRDRDSYSALGFGLEYARTLAGGLAAVAGGDIDVRSYDDLDAFDARTIDLHLGLHQRLDAQDSLQYRLRHNDFDLDHGSYRRMQSASAEWSRLFGQRARLAVGAQGYRIRYLREFPASSSDLVALVASGTYALDTATGTIGHAGLIAGYDNAQGRADGDREVLGASGVLQRRFAGSVDGYAGIALLSSEYRQQNPDFGITRADRQIDFSAGLSWGLGDGWLLRPQITRTRNRSNIPVNDYGRTEASLTLRREWN